MRALRDHDYEDHAWPTPYPKPDMSDGCERAVSAVGVEQRVPQRVRGAGAGAHRAGRVLIYKCVGWGSVLLSVHALLAPHRLVLLPHRALRLRLRLCLPLFANVHHLWLLPVPVRLLVVLRRLLLLLGHHLRLFDLHSHLLVGGQHEQRDGTHVHRLELLAVAVVYRALSLHLLQLARLHRQAKVLAAERDRAGGEAQEAGEQQEEVLYL